RLVSRVGRCPGSPPRAALLPFPAPWPRPTVRPADPEAVRVSAAARAVAIAATIATGLLFGAVPALTSTGADVAGALRMRATTESPSGRAAERRLLVVEIALVLVVLSSAALTIVSYRNLRGIDLGFAPD